MLKRILVTVLATFFGTAASTQAGLINGGFETGDLTGWTQFLTENGALGDLGDDVVPFDVNGDGTDSSAARFRVGEAVYPGVSGGGGIFQDVVLGAGGLVISADIAASSPRGITNLAGGLFELLFDGVVVDSYDFGSVGESSTERSSLLAVLDVIGGSHEVRLQMTRPYREGEPTARQFVDDVSLSGSAVDGLESFSEPPPTEPVPEPGSITLLGLGLLGLARARRRQRSH